MSGAADSAPKPKPKKQEQEDAVDEITEVAPGVLRMQLPMAFTGLGHVNTYALVGPDGVAVVDPGLPGKDTALSLRSRLEVAEIPVQRITEVIVTHSHPDHFGGAGLLAEKAGARIVASDRFHTWWDSHEDDIIEDPAEDTEPDPYDDGQALSTEKRKVGTPFGQPTPWGGKTFVPPLWHRVRFKARNLLGSRWFSAPAVDRHLADGERITLAGRDWQAMITPGHTEDHLCLYDPEHGVLLTGDHVLPTITPHISGLAGPDPLADYVESLRRVAGLEDVQTALPAHGHPFTDIAQRVDEIVDHHEDRIDRLMELVQADSPATVDEFSLELFGPHGRDPLALSETYAHLEHLRRQDRVTRRQADGQLLYGVTP